MPPDDPLASCNASMLLLRYITIYGRAYLIGVVVPCHLTPILCGHLVFEEVCDPFATMILPSPVYLVDSAPWLPQLVQSRDIDDKVQLRPIPWPSFWAYFVHMHGLKFLKHALPVVRFIWVQYISENDACMISNGTYVVWLIRSCQHVILVGLRCSQMQGTNIRTVPFFHCVSSDANWPVMHVYEQFGHHQIQLSDTYEWYFCLYELFGVLLSTAVNSKWDPSKWAVGWLLEGVLVHSTTIGQAFEFCEMIWTLNQKFIVKCLDPWLQLFLQDINFSNSCDCIPSCTAISRFWLLFNCHQEPFQWKFSLVFLWPHRNGTVS